MAVFFASFRGRLFGCFLVVATLALIVPVYYVRSVMHDALLREAIDRLHQEALLVQVFC